MGTEPGDLRERCRHLLDTLNRDAMLRQNSPVDTLLSFVLAERGRAADPALEPTLPLVLYFGSDADRDEFVAAIREVKPHMITRKLP